MSFVLVGVGVATGAAKIGMALSGGRARRREQKAAARELAKRKATYENLDTSNPYLNMENTMEDLTVNTQQADFMAQQNQQNQANIMQSMQGAAGGSGIAGLAQAMANQGAQQAQAASASIGQQESANQMKQAQMAGNIQMMERKGEVYSREQEKDKAETLLGMAQQRKGAADAARQRARSAVASGIGSIGGALAGGVTAGLGNMKEGKTFWGGVKE